MLRGKRLRPQDNVIQPILSGRDLCLSRKTSCFLVCRDTADRPPVDLSEEPAELLPSLET